MNNITIETVVAFDLPNAKRYKAASGFNIDCPFCGRKRKLNINVQKGVWACPACGEGGGFLTLHSKLHGHENDKKWASRDLYTKIAKLSKEQIKALENNSEIIEIESKDEPISKAYDLKTRNKIFHSFLNHLPISESFYKELSSEKRGNLNLDLIKKLGYRSYSNKEFNSKYGSVNAAEFAVIEALGMPAKNLEDSPKIYGNYFERTGSQVPGFTVKNHRIVAQDVKGCSFLPVRSRHGEISYLQTKFPPLSPSVSQKEKEKYKKYGRYMSYGKYGCSTSGLESIHYTYKMNYNSETTPEEVWLTEGILKSDIAATLSNKPFIALVGISVYSQLPEELKYLKEHGTKSIVVATDMDYINNPSVAKSLKKIISMIKDSGLTCKVASWNSEYKGIDDFLIAANKGTKNLELIITEK